jgi:hypothetical protein
MFEREFISTGNIGEKLRGEIEGLKKINNSARALLKIGVGASVFFALQKLTQGETVEASAAGIVAGAGLLLLSKDPLAWKIESKEAAIEEAEDNHLI